MAEKQVTKKNTLSTRWAHFQSLSSQDKRRTITDLLFNNAMYIIIVLAIIFIAIRVPQFISLSSIVNVISLTAAKLPIALGIAGCIVLTGTDISAGRAVGLSACISASLLTTANKIFPGLAVQPLPLVFLLVIAVGVLMAIDRLKPGKLLGDGGNIIDAQ